MADLVLVRSQMRQIVSRILALILVAFPFAVIERIIAIHRFAIIQHMKPQEVIQWFRAESTGEYYLRTIIAGFAFVGAVETVALLIRIAWPISTRET